MPSILLFLPVRSRKHMCPGMRSLWLLVLTMIDFLTYPRLNSLLSEVGMVRLAQLSSYAFESIVWNNKWKYTGIRAYGFFYFSYRIILSLFLHYILFFFYESLQSLQFPFFCFLCSIQMNIIPEPKIVLAWPTYQLVVCRDSSEFTQREAML